MPTSNHAKKYALNISDLNNDVLLMVIDHLLPNGPNKERYGQKPTTPLKELSMVNRRFQALVRPILFQLIALKKPSYRSNLPNGWEIAHRAIDGLQKNSTVLAYIKRLDLNLYGYVWENEYALDAELHFIVDFLRKLSNLRYLKIDLSHDYMLAFKNAVTDADDKSPLRFGNVTTLELEYRMAFLISHCPEVRSITFYDSVRDRRMKLYQIDFVLLFKGTPKVTYFKAVADWTPEEAKYVASALPDLRHLHMCGAYRHASSAAHTISLVGSAFKNLKALTLPNLQSLHLGWAPAGCGNVFMGPDGDKHYRAYQKRHHNALAKASNIAFGSIKGLQECWVGDVKVEKGMCMLEDEQITEE